MPRPKGSADLLENRRHRALTLLDAGRSLNAVARLIGCAASSVMRWRNRRRRGGAKALKVRFSPGRPPKLTRNAAASSCETTTQGRHGQWLSHRRVDYGAHRRVDQGQFPSQLSSRPHRKADAHTGLEPAET